MADFRAALAVEARIAAGADELVPASVADRLIDGAPPLRVWREHRGLSQSALARAAGVIRVQIVEIEAGRNTGSVHTLRKLADGLRIAVDDLIAGVTGRLPLCSDAGPRWGRGRSTGPALALLAPAWDDCPDRTLQGPSRKTVFPRSDPLLR